MSATLTEVDVNVTQEHIDKGKPRWCAECPVALAILAVIPGAVRAEVYRIGNTARDYRASVHGDDGTILLVLPWEAGDWIGAYDACTGEDGTDPYVALPFTFTAKVAA